MDEVEQVDQNVGVRFIAPPETNGQFTAPNGTLMVQPTTTYDEYTALPDGSIILDGRYRLLRLLHQRPRLNLYLAERLATGASGTSMAHATQFVAMRELVLTGLPPEIRTQVEQAAFEEFISPGVLGSPRLPGVGDRVRVEGERHYLVMQLRGVRGERRQVAVTLAELLLTGQHWPQWLNCEIALRWGTQLCRIVARLHHLGVVLGDLHPSTILVDKEGLAEWAPVLLISWPPPQLCSMLPISFLQDAVLTSVKQLADIFPLAYTLPDNPFAAPEMLQGEGDERSDVYTLGAILYLLLTRYAPASASRRECAAQESAHIEPERAKKRKGLRRDSAMLSRSECMSLIPPHLFNNCIPANLEQILLHALALEPAERYSSVFAMVEALEAVDLETEAIPFTEPISANGKPRISKVGKLVEWFKQERN